jgi:hypothetical protein
MEDAILRYRSALAYNREVFLIEHGEFVKALSSIDNNFNIFLDVLSTMRDRDRKSYVGLIPFVLLLQRQSRAAFEALTAFQSYLAWVLFRPGIEAVLIIGKWVDDPANAKIWQNRKEDWKGYQSAYSGKALTSASLPSSDRIRRVLAKVNDDFVHANPDYYSRHLKAGAGDPGYVNFWLDYFDDDLLQEAHAMAFLHLLIFMQDALASLLAKVFAVPVTLILPLVTFRSNFAKRMTGIAAKSEEAAAILHQLGLYS